NRRRGTLRYDIPGKRHGICRISCVSKTGQAQDNQSRCRRCNNKRTSNKRQSHKSAKQRNSKLPGSGYRHSSFNNELRKIAPKNVSGIGKDERNHHKRSYPRQTPAMHIDEVPSNPECNKIPDGVHTNFGDREPRNKARPDEFQRRNDPRLRFAQHALWGIVPKPEQRNPQIPNDTDDYESRAPPVRRAEPHNQRRRYNRSDRSSAVEYPRDRRSIQRRKPLAGQIDGRRPVPGFTYSQQGTEKPEVKRQCGKRLQYRSRRPEGHTQR